MSSNAVRARVSSRRRSGPRFGRLAVVAAGVFVYGAGASIATLDQAASLKGADRAQSLPAAVSASELAAKARRAIAARDPLALALAQGAVARAPMDPRSVSVLGQAQTVAGQTDAADGTLALAGTMGWREGYVLAYLYGQALDAGDFSVASMRFDAALRQLPTLVDNVDFAAPLLTDPAGQQALVERTMANPSWLTGWVGRVDGLSPQVLGGRAAILTAMGRRGGSMGCDGIAPLVQKLFNSNMTDQAIGLWRAQCSESGARLVQDGAFVHARLEQTQSDLDWMFLSNNHSVMALEPDAGQGGGAQRVSVQSDGPDLVPFLRQRVPLEQGHYRLSWLADGGARLAVAFACTPMPASWEAPRLDPASQRWTLDVDVDGQCPARWLTFALRPGNGVATLRAVTLRPVTPRPVTPTGH